MIQESGSNSLSIAVIGSGYVGTVVAACFASIGHHVRSVETDQIKLAALRGGEAPFYEAGLDELIQRGLESGQLTFTEDLALAVADANLVFLCVGTPPGGDGRPDLGAIESAVSAVASAAEHQCVVVTKSTVPVGTGLWMSDVFRDRGRTQLSVANNPEFLRQGSAVADFMNPARIVIGSEDPAARQRVVAAYRPILDRRPGAETGHTPPELVCTDLTTAEMIKYASNAFLATKVSFINEIARLCEVTGADVVDVAAGMGLDPRIGPGFLAAGVGWGGSCFGKDVDALAAVGTDRGVETKLLDAAREVNRAQRASVAERLRDRLGDLRGRRIALLGLAFKAGTDDLRDAPSLEIIDALAANGALVTGYDPAVKHIEARPITTTANALDAVDDADAVVIVTDWPEFAQLDLVEVARRMRGDVVFDGRNLLDPAAVAAAGLTYEGIGRPRRPEGS